MNWRLMRSGPLSGAMNMALDQALLEAVDAGHSGPVLRLYRWQRPTVTLGYAQNGRRVLDIAACSEAGVDIVRRLTGGRAVLHQHEITYAVIAPVGHPPFAGGILDDYRVIAAVLQEAIAALGVPATLQSRPSRKVVADGHPVCFLAPSSYELVCAGVKMAGSAQRRQGKAFLQHGSIPVDIDLALLARIFAGRRQSVEMLGRHIGWLNRWLAQPVDLDSLEECLAEVFTRRWSIAATVAEPTGEEGQRARELMAQRYDQPHWNLPPATPLPPAQGEES